MNAIKKPHRAANTMRLKNKNTNLNNTNSLTQEVATHQSIIIKHYAHIDRIPFVSKPTALEVGGIQKRLVEERLAQSYTLNELFALLTTGHTAKLSRNTLISGVLTFCETSLIALDIDDTQEVTKIEDIVALFNGEVAAYYYSFSHGVKGNRFRLLFQLQEPVTEEETVKAIQQHYRHILTSQYKGLDVDILAANTLVHGTRKGGVILDATAYVSQDTIRIAEIAAYKAKKEREEQFKRRAKLHNTSTITFDCLVEAAKKIGYIESGGTTSLSNGAVENNYTLWMKLSLAIKSHYLIGAIDYNQAWELYSIISGPEANSREFDAFKPNGSITIGTMLKYAQDKGYKIQPMRSPDEKPLYDVRKEKVMLAQNEYLSQDLAASLIASGENVLLESPTGSGKTSAIVNAAKEAALNNKNILYIYASPTIALTEQVAATYGIPIVKGGVSSGDYLGREWSKGNNIYSATYDQVANVIATIGRNRPYVLLVDEVHQLTTALKYRSKAIEAIQALIPNAKTFVGMTGTADDAYMGIYDKHIRVTRQGSNAVTAATMEVVRFDTKDSAGKTNKSLQNDILSTIIVARKKKHGIRSLVFLKNKERIDEIEQRLTHEGLSVITLSSETKETEHYKLIVNTKEIPDNVDVVLATNVISDGISINNKLNWQCIIVADNRSQIFNPAEIRQMAHRFRHAYRSLMLYVRDTDVIDDKAVPYRHNSVFNAWHAVTSGYCDYLNNTFDCVIDEQDLYSIERRHGIKVGDGNRAVFDANVLAHETARYKALYYASPCNRNVFVAEVAKALQVKISSDVIFNDIYSAADMDINGLSIEEIEEKTYTKEEKATNFGKWFSEQVYEDILEHREDALVILRSNSKQQKILKEEIGEARLNAIVKVCELLPYDAAKRHLSTLTRRAETNVLSRKIDALAQLEKMHKAKKRNITMRLYYIVLEKIAHKTLTTTEFKAKITDIVTKEIAKVSGVAKKLPQVGAIIKEVCELFSCKEWRDKNNRYKKLVPFDLAQEATALNLTEKELLDVYLASRTA